MKMFQLLCMLVLTLVSFSDAQSNKTRDKWNSLRITWNRNLSNPDAFVYFPRTETEAIKQGFTKIGDCNSSDKWRGNRYVKDNDYTVFLLFDSNGFIAGLQTSVSKSHSPTYPPSKLRPPFLEDGDKWVLTAYFIEPSRICTGGRSAEDFEKDGTATDIYIQNGTNPENVIKIPYFEEDTATTRWTKGKCFPLMGWHYYIDLRSDLPCDEIFPAFLNYNKGKLVAFGWTVLTEMTSKRFEVSYSPVFKYFMDPVPTCMYDFGVASTMHNYLINDVQLIGCP